MIDCITSPLLSAHPTLSHGFMTREGGVSTGLFDSLNAALEKQDNPDHVLENRRRIAHHLGAKPENLLTLSQLHSNDVAVVEEPWLHSERKTGDALVTTTPGLLISIITADCVPILLADPHAQVIAAVHAGWKGATRGIIENTLKVMTSLGAHRRNIIAAVGPCIWQSSYQVDQIFYDRVMGLSLDYSQFFIPSTSRDHWQFDLPGFVYDALKRGGVESISSSPADTYTNEDRFFSYRRKTHRGESAFGCGLSGIMLRSALKKS